LLVEFVTELFAFCVFIMRTAAVLAGLTYKEINAIVFLIVGPALVLLFFGLWRFEKRKSKGISDQRKG